MAEESALPPSRITSQAFDVLLKSEAEQIATLLPTRFGLDIAPIRRPLPTEFPQLSLHLQRLDTLFDLEDDGILHLEFQTRLTLLDLIPLSLEVRIAGSDSEALTALFDQVIVAASFDGI